LLLTASSTGRAKTSTSSLTGSNAQTFLEPQHDDQAHDESDPPLQRRLVGGRPARLRREPPRVTVRTHRAGQLVTAAGHAEAARPSDARNRMQKGQPGRQYTIGRPSVRASASLTERGNARGDTTTAATLS
jgi:hypothetical protein